jgi:hypothetical protein
MFYTGDNAIIDSDWRRPVIVVRIWLLIIEANLNSTMKRQLKKLIPALPALPAAVFEHARAVSPSIPHIAASSKRQSAAYTQWPRASTGRPVERRLIELEIHWRVRTDRIHQDSPESFRRTLILYGLFLPA